MMKSAPYKLFTFAGRFMLFMLPVAIVFIWLEYKLVRVPNSYNKKRYSFEKQLPNIKVLITGTSQSLYGLNPEYFHEPAFNIANSSQTFLYDKAITLKYLPQLQQLKCVVIPVSYFSFFYELSDTKEEWRDFFYYHFWDIKSPSLPLFDFRRYSFAAAYTPPTVLKFINNRFKTDIAPTLSDNGFMKTESGNQQDINDSTGRLRVLLHNSMQVPERFQQICNELEDLVKSLREKNIKVLFVTPPVYTTYSRFCDTTILKKNNDVITSLCKKYDCRQVSFFNDNTFGKEEFSDNDHLNETGAKHFSLLADAVVNEMIGKQ